MDEQQPHPLNYAPPPARPSWHWMFLLFAACVASGILLAGILLYASVVIRSPSPVPPATTKSVGSN